MLQYTILRPTTILRTIKHYIHYTILRYTMLLHTILQVNTIHYHTTQYTIIHATHYTTTYYDIVPTIHDTAIHCTTPHYITTH